MEYMVKPIDCLVVSIVVIYLGMWITRRIPFLEKNFIPPSVTGGLVCSVIVGLIYAFGGIEITFDMQIRDVLLLVFFSTVGLSAKARTLAAGGKALALLVAAAGVFLVVQDATGVALAWLLGGIRGTGCSAGASRSPAVTARRSHGGRRRWRPASTGRWRSGSPLRLSA
jgi:ESS family glutamate:Na+ symporter